MKRKILGAALLLTIGYGVGTVTTNEAKADSNYVLASVEWVLSKISPLENRMNQLEQRMTNLENGEDPGTPVDPPEVHYSNVIVTKATSVRKGADASYESFYTAPLGTVLSYNSTFTNSITGQKWYLVRLADNRIGAIIATDSSLSSETPTIFSKVFTPNASEIKRGAALSYETIYKTTAGQTLEYSSTFENSVTGEKWYIVKTPTGKFGAVLSKYAEVIK